MPSLQGLLEQPQLVQRIRSLTIPVTKYKVSYVQGIESWGVPAIFGGLLVLLANLQCLSIACYVKSPDGEFHLAEWKRSGFPEICFCKEDLVPADTRFLVLLKVESLYLHGRNSPMSSFDSHMFNAYSLGNRQPLLSFLPRATSLTSRCQVESNSQTSWRSGMGNQASHHADREAYHFPSANLRATL